MNYLKMSPQTMQLLKKMYFGSKQGILGNDISDEMSIINNIDELSKNILELLKNYEKQNYEKQKKDGNVNTTKGIADKISLVKIKKELFLKFLDKSCENIAVMCPTLISCEGFQDFFTFFGSRAVAYPDISCVVHDLSLGIISDVILIDADLKVFNVRVRDHFPWIGNIPAQFNIITEHDVKEVKFEDCGVKQLDSIMDTLTPESEDILQIFSFKSDQLEEILKKIIELYSKLPQHYEDYKVELEAKKNESSAEGKMLTEMNLTDKDIIHEVVDESFPATEMTPNAQDCTDALKKSIPGKLFQGD